MRNRRANGYLIIVLFAKHSAVLSGDANRVPTLFRDSRVIDDPASRSTMTPQCVQNMRLRKSEDRRINPLRIRDKMMHRLVLGSNMTRIYQGCHRFNALPTRRQQQSGKISLKRFTSVGVVDSSYNLFNITLKSGFSRIRGWGDAPVISKSIGKVHHVMTQQY
jgi:hypothetical protein